MKGTICLLCDEPPYMPFTHTIFIISNLLRFICIILNYVYVCLYGYHVHDCGLSTEARSVWSLELDLQAVVSHLKWGWEPNSSPLLELLLRHLSSPHFQSKNA